jgi:MbtH protein
MDRENRDLRATHQVIVNDQHQFVVWPARRRPPLGWRYVGKEGTKAELTFYLQQMAVETVPAPLLITDRRTLDTHWD